MLCVVRELWTLNSVWLSQDLHHLPEERRPASSARSRGRWGGRSTCPRASPPPSWWTWPAGRWTWWGRSHSGSLTLSPATLRRDGLLWLCLSCLPLAVITGLCVSLMDVFIASGLVQWIQIARIVNSKYPPPHPPSIFHSHNLLSLSEVSEGAGSLARNCRPLISLFSMKGLFS